MITKYGDVEARYGITLAGVNFHKFGRNPSSRNLLDDVVWSIGGSTYPWPAGALTTTIVSDSALDKVGGTGCSQVRVFGLDKDYNAIDEYVDMNGTTSVTLANKYLRVFRMYNSSDLDALGTISAKHGSTVLAEIVGNRNQTEMCVYTVPNNMNLFISQLLVSSEGNKEVAYTLWARNEGGVFRVQQNFAAYGQGYGIQNDPVMYFPEKTDIYVSGINKGSNDVVVAELFGALTPSRK